MKTQILEVGTILRNIKTNKLHQVIKVSSTAVFIKIIGDMLATPIRYTESIDITNNFIIEG